MNVEVTFEVAWPASPTAHLRAGYEGDGRTAHARPTLAPSCLAFLLCLLSPLASAQQARPALDGPNETIIAGDYFGAGKNLAPVAPVEGDAFLVGGDLTLQVPVAGDAALSGGSVAISGNVGDDLYATGGRVLLDSAVGGNARLVGGDVELSAAALVGGRATIAAHNAIITGRVGRQLSIFADRVTLDGEVAGNVTVAARRLTVGPHARINGKLTWRGPVPAVVDDAAVIGGGITHHPMDIEGSLMPYTQAAIWTSAAVATIGLWLIGVLGIVFLPIETAKVALLARSRPFSSLIVGLAAIIFMPLGVLLLTLTVIGIPVAFVLALAWPVLLIFGYLTGVMSITDTIAGSSRKYLPGNAIRIVLLALGMGGLLATWWLPMLGFVVALLFTIMGTGAIALNAFGGLTFPSREAKQETATIFRREPTLRF